METVTVPEERYGLVFVFRVFERVAYALVMDAARPLALSDTASRIVAMSFCEPRS